MVSEEGPLTLLRVRSFDELILETIDDVLKQILGETAAKTILLYLERKKGLKREKIPHNIEELSSGLTELLGSATHVLENLAVKLLCSKLQLEYDAKLRFTFPDYVQKLRERFKE